MYPDLKLFIAGKWRKTDTDMPVINPATEEELGRLPSASIKDLDDALSMAPVPGKPGFYRSFVLFFVTEND